MGKVHAIEPLEDESNMFLGNVGHQCVTTSYKTTILYYTLVKPSDLTNNKLTINLLDVIPYHPHLPHIILSSCATSWKVSGSIPDGVTGLFIDLILLAALWPGGQLSL